MIRYCLRYGHTPLQSTSLYKTISFSKYKYSVFTKVERTICAFILSNNSYRQRQYCKDSNIPKLEKDRSLNKNRESLWTIPNSLCVLRITLSPVFCYLIVHSYYIAAASVLSIAAISDFLDGKIARSFKSQSSKLGSFLDPLADKIFVTTLFASLTYAGLFPGLLTALIIFRDVLLLCGGSYIWFTASPRIENKNNLSDLFQTSSQLKPTRLSKINTGVQLSTGIISVLAPIFPDIITVNILYGLWCTTGVSTVASGISYVLSKDVYKGVKR